MFFNFFKFIKLFLFNIVKKTRLSNYNVIIINFFLNYKTNSKAFYLDLSDRYFPK